MSIAADLKTLIPDNNGLLSGHAQFTGEFAKLRKETISFIISVCPHGTTRFPQGRLSRNIIFEYI